MRSVARIATIKRPMAGGKDHSAWKGCNCMETPHLPSCPSHEGEAGKLYSAQPLPASYCDLCEGEGVATKDGCFACGKKRESRPMVHIERAQADMSFSEQAEDMHGEASEYVPQEADAAYYDRLSQGFFKG